MDKQVFKSAKPAACVAFAAWLIGTVYYVAGGGADQDLYAFPVADALLVPFGVAAAATIAILVRQHVEPFQPTILLDGLIVSLAAGALVALAMDATFLHGVEAGGAAVTLKAAYPLGAVMLLAVVLWVLAVTGWQISRTWTAAMVGLALAGISSTAFLIETLAGSYAAGTFADVLWLAGALVLAYAAWHPHDESASVRLEGPQRLTVTSLGATVALAVLVLGQFLSVGFAALALAAAALLALIVRVVVSFRESVHMFAHARPRRRPTRSPRWATGAS